MQSKIVLLSCTLLLAACTTTQHTPPPSSAKPPVKQMPKQEDLAVLRSQRAPERDGIRDRYRYDRAIKMTKIDGLRYYYYRPDKNRSVVGFIIKNDGSPKINPVGYKRKGVHREYSFLFPDRARENIYLKINDDVRISGRFSHDNMFRELHFFPRIHLPSLEVDQSRSLIKVTLPTGEPVVFDKESMEIVGGVLHESPIDFNRSRHQRRNPKVRYKGDYLALTVAQRGEAPRRAQVWGKVKYAEAHYPAKYQKACRLSPKHIWDQQPKPGDKDPRLTMLHHTDDAIFAMIERRCGWDLSALRGSPKVAGN